MMHLDEAALRLSGNARLTTAVLAALGATLAITQSAVAQTAFTLPAPPFDLPMLPSPSGNWTVMVGIGGAMFGGLSSFQTSYAKAHGFDYSLFFIGFMSAAILSRLFVAGYVVKKDPLYSLLILTSLTLVSILLFLMLTSSQLAYLGGAAMLGLGYGLTYSVINGLAANEAPAGLMPQSLLLFSLAYIIGVFGFPLIAGNLIVSSGVQTMLYVVLLLAVLNFALVLFRIALRATGANEASVLRRK